MSDQDNTITSASVASLAFRASPTTIKGTVYSCNPTSHSHTIAIAVGVGIAAGIVTAAIIILVFVFFRRRQAQTAKSKPTISPDVLVRGTIGEMNERWEEYREETHGLVDEKGGNKTEVKEPPLYTKGV